MSEYCAHPTDQAFYESFVDEEGCVHESYYCAACNVYLTNPEVQDIQARPEWITWRTQGDREEGR